jgi:hypothetical protein
VDRFLNEFWGQHENGANLMSEPAYHHTQKAPWFLLLFAFAALFFTVAWVTRAEPVLPAICSCRAC